MKIFKGLLSFLSIPALQRRRLKRSTSEQRTFSKIDYYRLQSILAHERSPAYKSRTKRIAQLRGLLLQARVCPCKEVPGDLVTMNSVLTLRSRRGSTFTITLVYPRDANAKERKCSILTAMGLGLIGKRLGDRFSKGMHIVEILYQPESTGKYYV